MLVDHINHRRAYRAILPEKVFAILEFLASGPIGELRPDQAPLPTPLGASGITAARFTLETALPDSCKAEIHHRFADIHYVIAGDERIGIAPDSGRNPVDEDHLASRDALFYRSVEGESFIHMLPGMFALLLPHDVHRPGCRGIDRNVIKTVVKIPMEIWPG